MTTFFASLLVAHVILGLVGVIASFIVTYLLIRDKFSSRKVICCSFIAFTSYVLSWLSGGWYYWKYYGAQVKPIILKGNYSWAHLVIMEVKEHMFLFLPFATFVLFLIVWLREETLTNEESLRKSTFLLSLCITVMAIVITLSGMLISGGAQ